MLTDKPWNRGVYPLSCPSNIRSRSIFTVKPSSNGSPKRTAASMRLQKDGYAVLENVLSKEACQSWAAEIASAFELGSGSAIAGNTKRVVGGRNLQAVWSSWREAVCCSPVYDFLAEEMSGGLPEPTQPATKGGSTGDSTGQFGLVRILYFDKPPGNTWNLAPHQDRTIAVERHPSSAEPYTKPTTKAGVAHVEADQALLSRMVTLRFHLDDMHAGNGPLTVIPGTHQKLSASAMINGDSSTIAESIEIHCDAGDVFAMRPLLVHGSKSSFPDCSDNRRVVHLEFAPSESLAEPYRWYRYDDVTATKSS